MSRDMKFTKWKRAEIESATREVFLKNRSVDALFGRGRFEAASELLKACVSRFGFVITGIKGFTALGLSQREMKEGFRQLAEAIGKLKPQDSRKSLVGELTGEGRGEDWYDEQPFHTDGGDLLALFCVRPATCGGGFTRLVSALAILEELRNSPQVDEEIFFENWFFHRGSRPGPPYFERSIFKRRECGAADCFFLPGTLRETPKIAGTPLSKSRMKALEKFEQVAMDRKMYWEYRLNAGELLLVNNNKVLHARNGYSDQSRCLLRSWIDL